MANKIIPVFAVLSAILLLYLFTPRAPDQLFIIETTDKRIIALQCPVIDHTQIFIHYSMACHVTEVRERQE